MSSEASQKLVGQRGIGKEIYKMPPISKSNQVESPRYQGERHDFKSGQKSYFGDQSNSLNQKLEIAKRNSSESGFPIHQKFSTNDDSGIPSTVKGYVGMGNQYQFVNDGELPDEALPKSKEPTYHNEPMRQMSSTVSMNSLKQQANKLVNDTSVVKRLSTKNSSQDQDNPTNVYSIKIGSTAMSPSYDVGSRSTTALYQSPSSASNYSRGASQSDKWEKNSVNSQMFINAPLRKLANQYEDPASEYTMQEYLQRQKKQLSDQLRNLMDKYNNVKRELNERIDMLQENNLMLENINRTSERKLSEMREKYETEMRALKRQIQRLQIKDEQTNYNLTSADTGSQFARINEEIRSKNEKIANLTTDISQSQVALEKQRGQIKMHLKRNEDLLSQLQIKDEQLIMQQTMGIKNDSNHTISSDLKKQLMNLQNDNSKLRGEISELNVANTQQRENIGHLENQAQNFNEQMRSLLNQLNTTKSQKAELSEEAKRSKAESEAYLKKIEETTKKYLPEIQQARRRENNLKEQLRIKDQAIERMKRDFEEQIRQIKFNSPTTQNNQPEPPVRDASPTSNELGQQLLRWKSQYKFLQKRFQDLQAQQRSMPTKATPSLTSSNSKNYEQERQTMTQSNRQLYAKLTQKEKELQGLQYECSRIKGLFERQTMSQSQEKQYSKQEIQSLQQRLGDMTGRLQTESKYRKEIQSQVYSKLGYGQGTSGQDEVVRTLKGQIQANDERLSRLNKELKAKNDNISALKLEIREMLGSRDNEVTKAVEKELKRLTMEDQTKTADSFEIFRSEQESLSRLSKEKIKKLTEEFEKCQAQLETVTKELTASKDQMAHFAYLYSEKCEQIEGLQKQVSETDRAKEQEWMNRLSQSQTQCERLRSEISFLKEEIGQLRQDFKRSLSEQRTISTTLQLPTFEASSTKSLGSQGGSSKSMHEVDQSIKKHLEEATQLKENLTQKAEQMFKLRDNAMSYRSTIDNMKSEHEILKLKHLSEKKTIEVSLQIEIQNLKSRLQSEEKRYNTLDQKLRLIQEDAHKKDQFIIGFIMSKKLDEGNLVSDFITKFSLIVGDKPISKQLQADGNRLENLEKKNQLLVKEIVQLKETILKLELQQVPDSLARKDSRENTPFNNTSSGPKSYGNPSPPPVSPYAQNTYRYDSLGNSSGLPTSSPQQPPLPRSPNLVKNSSLTDKRNDSFGISSFASNAASFNSMLATGNSVASFNNTTNLSTGSYINSTGAIVKASLNRYPSTQFGVAGQPMTVNGGQTQATGSDGIPSGTASNYQMISANQYQFKNSTPPAYRNATTPQQTSISTTPTAK